MSSEVIFGDGLTRGDMEDCPEGWELVEVSRDDDSTTLTYEHDDGISCTLSQIALGKYNIDFNVSGDAIHPGTHDSCYKAAGHAKNLMQAYTLGTKD